MVLWEYCSENSENTGTIVVRKVVRYPLLLVCTQQHPYHSLTSRRDQQLFYQNANCKLQTQRNFASITQTPKQNKTIQPKTTQQATWPSEWCPEWWWWLSPHCYCKDKRTDFLVRLLLRLYQEAASSLWRGPCPAHPRWIPYRGIPKRIAWYKVA